jgi:hypothetical protein
VKRAVRALIVPTLALVSALLVGALVMVFSDPDALRAWASFLRNPGNALSVSWQLV